MANLGRRSSQPIFVSLVTDMGWRRRQRKSCRVNLKWRKDITTSARIYRPGRVFVKTSPKCSYSVIENERFWLVFAKTGSIISGTDVARVSCPACGKESGLFCVFQKPLLVHVWWMQNSEIKSDNTLKSHTTTVNLLVTIKIQFFTHKKLRTFFKYSFKGTVSWDTVDLKNLTKIYRTRPN